MNRVTVAICTFNRCAALDRTLRSFESLEVPQDIEWELLVVDNKSTDDTPGVVSRYAQKLPVRYFFEGTPGKSRAANLAVRQASGELMLWTDDDVIVDGRWLLEYVKAARACPDASFFGGTVEPLFEAS